MNNHIEKEFERRKQRLRIILNQNDLAISRALTILKLRLEGKCRKKKF